MPTFRDYDNLGKKGAVLVVRFYVYFDDPEREGNFGGVGFDDEHLERVCPNAGIARSWAPKLAKQAEARWPGCHVSEAEITTFEWVDSSYEADDRMWFNADREDRLQQYGYPKADGTWKWGELEPRRSW